jgi:hypothetical protein
MVQPILLKELNWDEWTLMVQPHYNNSLTTIALGRALIYHWESSSGKAEPTQCNHGSHPKWAEEPTTRT